MIDSEKYEAALRLEAAQKLDPERQGALDRLRSAGAVPPLANWTPDHPHIRGAEQAYGLPAGMLSGVLSVENAPGDPLATSPRNTTSTGQPSGGVGGLFQVTEATGAPYGLTATNKFNPYLNTDVAARHLKDLLAQTGGDPRAAMLRYKGHTEFDASNEKYLRIFEENMARYGGGLPTTVASPPPAPAVDRSAVDTTPPLPTSAETTSPTSQTAGQEFRARAGFGAERASGIPGVLGQVFDNLNTGPIGPLLKVLGIPGAAVGTAVNQLGDSRSVGNLAQLTTDVLGGRALSALTPRSRAAAELERLGVLNPARTADTMTDTAANLTQTAVREGPARLGVTPQTVEKAAGRALNEAQTTATRMNARAVAAARESNAAGVPLPTAGKPARTLASPIVDERGVPYTRREPAVPARSVTGADVPPDLVVDRAVTRTLSDAAQHFQRHVDKASDAATPQSAINILLRGAKVSGFGKAGVKLPHAEAARIEAQVSQLVEKMVTASPEHGVKLLERAATLKGLDVPELTQAKALLADAEQYRGQAVEVAARMEALQRYLQSPSLIRRMTGVLLPAPVRKVLGIVGKGAAIAATSYAGAKVAGAGSGR